jgi:type I restriction enzyme S subunit
VAEQTAVGTKMPRTSWEALSELAVFCPEPPEQRAIADVLDGVDASIQQKEVNIEKLKQVKQGLLHDLLTRGIDSDGELRPASQQDPSQYGQGRLGPLPLTWKVAQVDWVLQGIDAGKSPDCQDIPARGDEWGVLKVGAVNPERFKPEENKIVRERHLKNPAYLLRKGDLLFSRANTFELVGLVSQVESPCGHLMLSDKTLRLVVRDDRMTPRFLFWQLQHNRSRAQIEIAATGTSGSMKNISQGSLEKIWICRPPLEEQREISFKLDGIAKRCSDEEEQLSKLRVLKAGLMDDLLTGRVRVTPLLEK